MTTRRPAAAVIGSGFGGLALAVRLQAAGVETTLVEQRDKPGGRAYVYEDAGFTFDAGPTIITDPTCLEVIALRAFLSRKLIMSLRSTLKLALIICIVPIPRRTSRRR